MKKTGFLILFFMLLLESVFLFAAGKYNSESSRRELKFGKKKITVRQTLPPKYGQVKGILPSAERTRAAVERFQSAIEKLPSSFVQRSGIRFVTVLEDLTLFGKRAAGIASGNMIYLNADCSEKTVFHEFFHIFDPVRDGGRWKKLNHKDFVYTGSQFYEIKKLSRRKRKRKEQNLANRTFDQDFVSRYAMSNEREDRAETFAYMMAEGKSFMLRVRRSPVLKKKMEFIIAVTSSRKLMGKEYWKEHLDLSENP